ncbi:hypothetical protein TCAL_03984 [Tigriopus californicus]|uniref:G-protein coupled receptors family 1 profile domain-containing protein n=2 Tax=Tigriopus californicus TaxID=6832 RepID=A0A553NFT5_TIGCA|nr:hypothetical protein TCAL_03984 [Tigriopus californicus]
MSSIFTLTTLAISRSFIVSCQPLSAGSNCLSQKSRGSNSYFAILTSIIIIWSFSIIVSIPPILGWGSYVLDQSRISCGPNWSAPDQDFQYCLFMFILGFFVPVGIIMSSNFSVVLTMRRHTASKTNPYLRSIAERRERGATRILMLMTLAFFICWMPYACLSLFSMAGGNVQSAWHVLPILFAKSSVCWNPFLYIFCNDEFKRIIRTHFSDPVPASMLLLERGTFGRRARHPGLMVRSEARQLTLSPKSSKEFKSCMAHFSLDNERSSIVIVQNHGEILAIGRV